MKTPYRLLGLIAAISAMSLVSCQKENFNQAGEDGTITVHATVEDVANATKSHIEGTQLYWDAEEQMEIVAFDGENAATHATSTGFKASGDHLTATFTVPDITENKTKIAGVHPASVSVADNKYANKYEVILPSVQNATADSYDPSAYIVVTRPEDVSSLGDSKDWHASYVRVTALNRFDVTGLKESIKSVTITFPTGQEAAGRRYIDLNSATGGEVYLDKTNEITVNYAAPLVPADGAATVWFASWNVSVAVGETVTIKAASDTKTYTKTFTAGKEFSLLENYLNILPIDMTGATEEDIQTGEDLSGEYLIVAEGGNSDKNMWVCMSNENTGSYFASKQSSIPSTTNISELKASDFYNTANIENYVWVVQKSDNGYTIHNRSNKSLYVKLENTTENEAFTSEEPYLLTITTDTEGTLKIQNPENALVGDSKGDQRWLQYNSRNPRFANYKSGQTNIYLIAWEDSTEPMLVVSESEKTVGADATEVSFDYTARNLTEDIKTTENDPEGIITSVNVNKDNSTIDVTLKPNEEPEVKTASITLSSNGVQDVVLTITQEAYNALADIVLSFPDDNRENNKVQVYNTDWTATIDNYSWAIYAFNNNNWSNGWNYIRCGGKKSKGTATISTETSMPKISSVDVEIGSKAKNIVSITLVVYSDSSLNNQICSVDPDTEYQANSTLTYNIPAEYQAAGQYYKLEFAYNNTTTSNGCIEVSSVTYKVTE